MILRQGEGSRRRVVGAAVAAMIAAMAAVATPPANADYESLYVLGLRAVDQERYLDGVILFAKAIEQRPEPGGLVRPYGTWSESYVPRYYLGVCFYYLDRFADAEETWKEFEAHAVARYPRNRSKLKHIEELRRGMGQALVEARDRLRSEIAALERSVGDVDESWFRQRSGAGGKPELLARLKDALEQLDGAQAAELSQVLRGLRPEVEDGWRKLEDASRARQIADRESAIAQELAERQRRRDLLDDAVEKLAAEGCSIEAVEVLRELLHRSTLATPDLRPSLLAARLAQAFLACEDPERAGVYLDLARRDAERRGTTDELERMTDLAAPETEASVEKAETLVARARAWLSLGECRPEILTWIEQVEAEMSASELAILRAQSYRNCGSADRVEQAVEARSAEERNSEEWQRLEAWLRESSLGRLYGESHALLIVAHDYDLAETGWSPLPGALEDLEAMRQALAAQGFSIEVLRNPKFVELLVKMQKFVARRGRNPDNRLLIYFAGHGWTEEKHGQRNGYVVPVDAPHPDRGDEAFEYLVTLSQLGASGDSIKADHSFFIFDSCFGGQPFEQTRSRVEVPAGGTQELLERPARLFLSAGAADEAVPDFSVFRRAVVRGLSGEADGNSDRLVLGHELAEFVREQVQDQSYTTPQWGLLARGELATGDIAFESRGEVIGRGSLALEIEDDFWSALEAQGTSSLLSDYVELYPGGTYVELARGRLGLSD